MSTVRIDMRLDKEIKVKAEKASALLGLKSLTEYVVDLINHDATKVIAEHEAMTLKSDVFDRFMASCDKLEAPNQNLTNALIFTREQEANASKL